MLEYNIRGKLGKDAEHTAVASWFSRAVMYASTTGTKCSVGLVGSWLDRSVEGQGQNEVTQHGVLPVVVTTLTLSLFFGASIHPSITGHGYKVIRTVVWAVLESRILKCFEVAAIVLPCHLSMRLFPWTVPQISLPESFLIYYEVRKDCGTRLHLTQRHHNNFVSHTKLSNRNWKPHDIFKLQQRPPSMFVCTLTSMWTTSLRLWTELWPLQLCNSASQ